MSGIADSLTDEQRAAVNENRSSVALSAGAGCGKTTVLTRRFLKPLQPQAEDGLAPEQLDQIIAITFTERAAREMRDRIRNECQKALQTAVAAEDDESIDYWRKLNRYLDTAKISTIHSFCAQLLRAHAVDMELDPRFRVVEQAEAETLRAKSIEDSLRQLISDHDADTLALLVRFSFADLMQTFSDLFGQSDRDRLAEWTKMTAAQLLETWRTFFANHAGRLVLGKVARHPAAKQVLALAKLPLSDSPVWKERQEVMTRLLAEWQALGETDCVAVKAACAGLDDLLEAARIQGINKWLDVEAKDKFKVAAAKLRTQISSGQGAVSRNWQEDETLYQTAEYALRFLRVGVRVLEGYAQAKREAAALDFDDLLLLTHRLLTENRYKRLQKQLTRQVRMLLVDEFQDTDPLQVALVRSLCGDGFAKGKLFVVGDLKQSIYRFRGAQPQVFETLRGEIPVEGRLPLSTNFRSQPAILDFVNALFHDELTAEYQPLVASRPQVAELPSIEFLWAAAEDTSVKDNAAAMRARDADWLARSLRNLVDSRRPLVYEKTADGQGLARPAEWGDCAVLFRRLTYVEEYENAFRKYDIPYYLVGGHAFYAQQEIFDVLNLLRAVAWPADAVSLAGVLRSPFFSLADETLFWLGQHPRGLTGGFAAGLTIADDEEERKRIFASETLRELRRLKDRLPVAELLERAFDLTAFDAAMTAEFMGPRKLANLNKLVDQARAFDRAGIFALPDFIEQLSRSVADEPKEPFAPIHPEKSNVVRLMTIHLSKGLEFPVVAVPDLDGGTQGDRSRFRFTPELGPMLRVPGAAGEDSDGGALDFFKMQLDEEDEAEARRLFYVATTRAADHLILSSGVEKPGEPKGAWTQLLSRHFDLLTGQCLSPLADGKLPQVRVILNRPKIDDRASSGRARRDLTKLAEQLGEATRIDAGKVLPLVEPVAVDASARRQFSFSQLTGLLEPEKPHDEADRALHYLQTPAGDDPLQFGTLVHAVLGAIDFAAKDKHRDVASLVARHAARQGMYGGTGITEAAQLIEQFLQAPTATAMRQARRSFVELEFLFAWPPGSAEPNAPYLHGYIDRLWQDVAGAWHILDFKTNRVTAENMASVAQKYARQMFLYHLAVEQIFGQSPASASLHFLRGGWEQTFEWTAAQREQIIGEIGNAIVNSRLTSKLHVSNK